MRTHLGGFAMPGSVEWTRRQNMRAGNYAFLEPGDAARLAGYMADRWEHVEQLAHERRMTPRQIQAEQARGPAMNAVQRFRERQQEQKQEQAAQQPETQTQEQKPVAVEQTARQHQPETKEQAQQVREEAARPAEPHETARKDPAHEHEIDELDMTHPDSPHNPENYRAPQSKVVEHRLEMGRRGERRQERIEQIRSAPGRMVEAVRERLTHVRSSTTRMMEASRERLGQVGQRLGINRPEPAAAEIVRHQCDGMEQRWRAEYAQRTAPVAHGVVDRLRQLAPGAIRHEMQRRQAVMRGDLSGLGRQDREGLQSFLRQKWGGMEALARDQKQIYRQMAEQGRSVAAGSADREKHWAGMEKQAQQRQEQFRAPPEVEKPPPAHKQEPKRTEQPEREQKQQPATPQRDQQKTVQLGAKREEKAQAREAARASRVERETQEKERARDQQPERAHERSR
ncbi:MAG: hypothetical protein P8011_00080 [Acidihalobacter sp.]